MAGVPDQERRTLPPSPKRQADARKKGQYANSRDVTTVAVLAGGVIGGMWYTRPAFHGLIDLVRANLRLLSGGARDHIVADAATAFVAISSPIALGAVLGWLVSTVLQMGFPPAFTPFKLDISRVLSADSIGNLFSLKEMASRAAKSTAKVSFVAAAAVLAVMREVARFDSEPALTGMAVAGRLVDGTIRLALYAGGALALLAALDYGLARRKHNAQLRMTPEEAKRDHREQEGDPQIRRKRRQRMRELARRRLMVAVKSADVVLVNPTEYAVALRYRSNEDRAPRVVAKGRDLLAQKIRDIARSANVPIIPQPPLTRLLYKAVPEGKEIPSALYHAVAEVLAYVYRLRRRIR